MYFDADLVRFVLIFANDMRVKNIGAVKFLSPCKEQPTMGIYRKTDPFCGFFYPRHTISY